MKAITFTITDDDIRYYIGEAVAELEEENLIQFPDSDSRSEFIEDCAVCTLDRYELYEENPFEYCSNYDDIVYDTARLYGSLL